MKAEEILDFVKGFIEGRIRCEDFHTGLLANREFQDIIDDRFEKRTDEIVKANNKKYDEYIEQIENSTGKQIPKVGEFYSYDKKRFLEYRRLDLKPYDYSLSCFLMDLDISTLKGKATLHGEVTKIFDFENCTPAEKYSKEYSKYFDLHFCLSYVDCERFTQKLIDELPAVSLTEKKKLMKERMKELFKYDKKPPNWIQSAEWPIKNDKPMTFREQKKTQDGYLYYFYDENEEEVVEQYY